MKTSVLVQAQGDDELRDNIIESFQLNQNIKIGNGLYQIISATSEPIYGTLSTSRYNDITMEVGTVDDNSKPTKSKLELAQTALENSVKRLHQDRIENYKSQDKKSELLNVFDEPWFERQVMNLGAGYPASAVADALEKAAEFVRNQAVTWEDKK